MSWGNGLTDSFCGTDDSDGGAMPEFKHGDKVMYGDQRCLVVGPDPCGKHPDRTVVMREDGGANSLHSFRTSELIPIPDTVSVTVELPRDKAQMVADMMRERIEWDEKFAPDHNPDLMEARRIFTAALDEALP